MKKTVPVTIETSLRAALAATTVALEEAIDKRRLDFHPYWVWFDGPRAQAIAQARALLGEA